MPETRVTYKPARGPQRRVVYERREQAEGHWRVEKEWNGCRWRTVGREPVEDLVVEGVDAPAVEAKGLEAAGTARPDDGEGESR